MSTLDIKSQLIGVPDLKIEMDDDLLRHVQASQGQMLLPLLLAQVLRKIHVIETRLEKQPTACTHTPDIILNP